MIGLLLRFLNTPLINGNVLEAFKFIDVVIEQWQMKIEFMSLAEWEKRMSFDVISST